MSGIDKKRDEMVNAYDDDKNVEYEDPCPGEHFEKGWDALLKILSKDCICMGTGFIDAAACNCPHGHFENERIQKSLDDFQKDLYDRKS